METNRRQILRTSLAAVAAIAAPLYPMQAMAEESDPVKGRQAYSPVYNVLDFSAKPDGLTMNTMSIQRAVDLAAKAGGGTVYFPAGNYLTGTILFRNHVTIHLESGAVLWGSKERSDYSQESLIYAKDADNIAICGRGIIDGNGTSFWTRANKPSGGTSWVANKWRPAALATFVNCTNLLIENVTFRNSPAWNIHPIECDLVTIQGISIVAGIYEDDGPNTDGIDPDACSRVRISDCYIQTGDDSIVLKCTDRMSSPGRVRACRDIVITNCVLISSDAALKIGTETHGEFRNIAISNCVIHDAETGIEIWMRDGGLIDGCTIDNISMTLGDRGRPIFMAHYPRDWPRNGAPPPGMDKPIGGIQNVTISNVEAVSGGSIFLQGMRETHLKNITLMDIRLHVHAGSNREAISNRNPPYPFLRSTTHTPFGIYCCYVSDLRVQNVRLTWGAAEAATWGCAIECESVNDLEIERFAGRQSRGSDEPAIYLVDTNSAFVHNCWALEGTEKYLGLGKGSRNISLMSNDLYRARKTIESDPAVDSMDIFEMGNRPPKGSG
jgi:hypothetical protein